MIVKALIVAGAVAAATVGVVAPAWAGQNVSAKVLDPPVVYGAFHHQGDRLQLVQDCSGVVKRIGYLQVRNGAEMKTYYLAKKGQPHRSCGERWINRNFREGRDISIRVCFVQRGADRCSAWRWGIA
jgi:hypothetical protein